MTDRIRLGNAVLTRVVEWEFDVDTASSCRVGSARQRDVDDWLAMSRI